MGNWSLRVVSGNLEVQSRLGAGAGARPGDRGEVGSGGAAGKGGVCFSVAAVAGVAETAQTGAKTQTVVAEVGGGKHNVGAFNFVPAAQRSAGRRRRAVGRKLRQNNLQLVQRANGDAASVGEDAQRIDQDGLQAGGAGANNVGVVVVAHVGG